MGKSRRYDDNDPEAEAERRPLPPPDPSRIAERNKFWEGEIRKNGGAMEGIRRGGVYRLPGYDHDGRSISHEEELALDRAAGCEFPDDNPLLREREDHWRDLIARGGRQDGKIDDVYRPSPNHDHDGRPVGPDERQRREDSQGIVSPDDPTNDG